MKRFFLFVLTLAFATPALGQFEFGAKVDIPGLRRGGTFVQRVNLEEGSFMTCPLGQSREGYVAKFASKKIRRAQTLQRQAAVLQRQGNYEEARKKLRRARQKAQKAEVQFAGIHPSALTLVPTGGTCSFPYWTTTGRSERREEVFRFYKNSDGTGFIGAKEDSFYVSPRYQRVDSEAIYISRRVRSSR